MWLRGGAFRAGLSAVAVLLVAPALAHAATPEVRAYQGTGVDRALDLQYELGSDVPFVDAPFIGTHNSFNSVAEMGPALSPLDSNQRLTILDQLRIDVRSLELDVHRFPSLEGGGFAPVVCHATEQHGGCTIEKPLGPILDDIAGWLRRPANRDQVLLLYLEDHLDNEQGYNKGAAVVRQELGGLLYEPPGRGCTELPLSLTRDKVRRARAQVVAVSDCGVGSGWPSVIFDWSSHLESRPFDYTDFPRCGPDFSRADYETRLIRYFEDSTQLTATAGEPDDGITPATAAAMARCGVDLFGLDQLVPDDGRHEKLVWSWAPGQPKQGGGHCALQRVSSRQPSGRWFARACGKERSVACRSGDDWRVLQHRVSADAARGRCRRRDALHAVPRTGFEAQLLRRAMERHDVRSAWLGYRFTRGEWRPLDRRG